MDVKLSSPLSSTSTVKQFDFCDDLSEHGYGSLEDLNCPTATSTGSPIAQGCDVSSSSLPTTSTTTTITSSPPSSSTPLSFSSSIDSIARLNNPSSSSAKSESTSSPDCKSPHRNAEPTGDQDSDTNNNLMNSSAILDNSVDNSLKKSNHLKENSSEESKNDLKINDVKVHLMTSPQMLQSGNRFRFVPKNRQNNTNDTKCRNGMFQSNGRNNPRGPRKSSRSESDFIENKKRSQMRNRNNEDIVFIIRKVDRSLRRTVSESSGETLPVRGILKYPRGWNRRTQSESNCDNSEQTNLMDSHENGQTQSLECISPLEASCEASTEFACSSAGEHSPGHESEEKPKKSVHFNCYVSKATFNINSTILNNNKHSGSNKKKNRKQNNNNHPSSNSNNDLKSTNSKPNKNQKNPNNLRFKSSQHQQDLLESIDASTNIEPTPTRLLTEQSVNCDATKTDTSGTDSVILTDAGVDKEDENENIDPMETKLRSRQDSGYDSETSDRKGFVEDSGTTTCVKSPNRQFTVKKVDLN